MEKLKLLWLGHPLVEWKGRPVKLETRKAAALLAYLSLTPGESQREILATMLWPEGSQQKSLANLRRTLSSLNSGLPGWIEADRETIRLKRNGGLWVDVESFHQSLSQLKKHSHPENEVCDECLSALDKTVELYRGDFMEGLNLTDAPNFDDWQFFQRDGLRQEFADVLQRLTFGRSERGHWDQAILHARRWVAMDRLHEPACRALMDLYARSGQRTAALRQYEELARSLKDQMGQEPEQETRRLVEQIRGREEAKQIVESSERSTSFPLLKTKLYIPTAPAFRVTRPHLIERLGEVEKKALTIVSAPAGFGKTTLLAEWIAQTSLPVSWLSLDNGDNDPYRFLSYLIATLGSIHEEVGLEAQQIMRSPQLAPLHVVLASLLNDLGKVAESFAFILDDYQFITEHAIHEAMAYLLDHVPSNMHIVIATRADPPLQLGRLRAHGQMLELRIRDLRFTPQEATEFLNDVMRLGLSAEDIEALETRTEGWVVGLKMAALSLKEHENASEFIRAFSGSHRYVLDYLVEEVLKRQSLAVQEFLLRTSILDRLCSSLCTAVVGSPDDGRVIMPSQPPHADEPLEHFQGVLEHLAKSNLFITSLDDQHHWYRYHMLFAQLLRSRLHSLRPSEEKELHKRAAYWYEQQDFVTEAIHHGLLAGDVDWAADLVESRMLDTIHRGQVAIALGWIHSLPAASIHRRPYLCLYYAWSLVFSCQPTGVPALVEIVEDYLNKDLPNDERAELTGFLNTVKAYESGCYRDYMKIIPFAELALKNLDRVSQGYRPKENLHVRSTVNSVLAAGLRMTGDLLREENAINESLRIAKEEDPSSRIIHPIVELADLNKKRGRLRKAEELYLQVINTPADPRMRQEIPVSDARIGLADLLREKNQLSQAKKYLQEGLESYQHLGNPNSAALACAIMVRVLLAERNTAGAHEALEKIERLNQEVQLMPGARTAHEEAKALYFLKSEDREGASKWIAKTEMLISQPHNVYQERLLVCLARFWLSQGKYRQAAALLDGLAEIAFRQERIYRYLEILILKALASHAAADEPLALERIGKALEIAQPEGFIRVFLDEGEPTRDLLTLRRPDLDGILADFDDHLLDSFERHGS